MGLFVSALDWPQVAGGGVAGAILVIVFAFIRWFVSRKNGNGNSSSGSLPPERWDRKFDELAERNEKSFESALRILVVPMMQKTNDILKEYREDARLQLEGTQRLTEAVIKLTLRDEVREEMRRSASA
jgi:hypothetical protein